MNELSQIQPLQPVINKSILEQAHKHFSIVNDIDEMKKKMLDDTYVLDGLALLGESTIFFASPNTGKTLITMNLIIEGINNNNFEPSNLIYLNMDDGLNALTVKAEIAKEYGFNMYAPTGSNAFTPDKLTLLMEELIKGKEATGVIIVLDTLKKFTDLMNKKVSSEFNCKVREFTANGGTVISLAHTNKHKNSEGRSVYGGTSDSKDDADCIYILDIINEDSGTKTVEFINDKARGAVDEAVSFSYDTTQKQNYIDLLNSVKRLTESELADNKRRANESKYALKNAEIIDAIYKVMNKNKANLLGLGVATTTQILAHIKENGIASEKATRQVLNKLTDTHWTVTTGTNNAKTFTALIQGESDVLN